MLTCKGTVGSMAILNEDKVHIARQIMGIHSFSNISLAYIQLVIETIVEKLKAVAKSMIPGISRDDVLSSLIPIPPLKEQNRIVEQINCLLPIIETICKQ